MTDILLVAIDAKYIHSNLAIYDLQAAAARQRPQDRVGRREFTINQPEERILAEIFREEAKIVCFSCYIWNIGQVRRVAHDLHQIAPGTQIWLGGPEVSYNAAELMEEMPYISGIMCGEGEDTFLELCRSWSGRNNDVEAAKTDIDAAKTDGDVVKSVSAAAKTDAYVPMTDLLDSGNNEDNCCWNGNQEDTSRQDSLEDIKGIVYRQADGSIRVNPMREAVDMDQIPFCYTQLEDLSLDHRIIYYESSRGCPFGCSYCLSSIDRKVRFRSLDLVFAELQYFIDAGVPQVKFVDRTFNCNHARTMAIWQYLIDHDRGVTNFHFEIAAELLKEDEIALLSTMRPALIQLEIGVQTANPQTMKEIHRPSSLENLEQIVARLHAPRNIHLHLDLIAGLPLEDIDSFARSFDRVYAMEPDQLQMGFLKVLKGSYMAIHRKEYGLICHREAPFEVLFTKWLSYADILSLKDTEAVLELYYNSGQFTRSIPFLLPYYESPYHFYKELGEYYRQEGYDLMSSSRMKKYEILRAFARRWITDPEEEEKLDQQLIMDLYLRENLKKRADWMPDPAEWKDAAKALCREKKIKQGASLHVEAFAEEGKIRFIAFDYSKRDPMSQNARMIDLNEE